MSQVRLLLGSVPRSQYTYVMDAVSLTRCVLPSLLRGFSFSAIRIRTDSHDTVIRSLPKRTGFLLFVVRGFYSGRHEVHYARNPFPSSSSHNSHYMTSLVFWLAVNATCSVLSRRTMHAYNSSYNVWQGGANLENRCGRRAVLEAVGSRWEVGKYA